MIFDSPKPEGSRLVFSEDFRTRQQIQSRGGVLFSSNVSVLWLPKGLVGGESIHLAGTYSAGWPDASSLVPYGWCKYGTAVQQINAAFAAASGWTLLLGAHRSNSTNTAFGVTFSRLRIEYKL